MDEMKQQWEQATKDWTQVSKAIKANPAIMQPHLPTISAEQLDEVMSTITYWFDRIRSPQGFAPVFQVAKSFASTALPSVLNSIQNLAQGNYGYFPTFALSLNQMLSALHSMFIFSENEGSLSNVGAIAGQLSQSIALLNTAQTELSSKSKALSEASEVIERLESSEERVSRLELEAKQKVDSLDDYHSTALEKLEEIKSSADEIEQLKSQLEKMQLENEKLQESLTQGQKSVSSIENKLVEQQKLVEALLPKAASAGLASAFADRVNKLERSRITWMSVFIGSLVLLGVFSIVFVLRIPIQNAEPLWQLILERLPLAAPLIWLAWFSAVQYGNTLRVQEDYAFKEATSKAFAGYRDHMEHMVSVEMNEAATAMTLLSSKTIEILAHEPLRLLQRSDHDATPMRNAGDMLSRIRNRGKQPDQGEGE